MDRRIPRPGEIYTDQEGKPHQILCVADHFDTREKAVVYQTLYEAFECLIMPVGLFMRKMHKKPQSAASETESVPCEKREARNEQRIFHPDNGEGANPALLDFLDADTLEEKYQIIKSLQHSITDRLIDDFAVTLDLVIPEGRLDDRYQQLLSSVRTMQKFETNRFRR